MRKGGVFKIKQKYHAHHGKGGFTIKRANVRNLLKKSEESNKHLTRRFMMFYNELLLYG